jgi:predicted GIY-YIG superfamily endonuclease
VEIMSVRKREWVTRKGESKQAWIVDYRDQHGKRHIETFQRKKDADAHEVKVLADIGNGVHVAPSDSITLHERVADKFAGFLADDVEPGGYLYRHYHPNGDLLYVGITLSVLDRTAHHFSEAQWRDLICLIMVEPFATREQALEAEEVAIRTEFPKYNRTHNSNRHPLQEMARLQRRAERAASSARR